MIVTREQLSAAASDPRIGAVLFDWGGTLARYLGDVPGRLLWRAADDVMPQRVSSRFADALATRIEQSWALGTCVPDTIESITTEIVEEIASPEVTGKLGTRFVKRFLSLLEEVIEHHTEAKSVLEELRSLGFQTAMLCNTIWPAVWHDQLLERDGIISLLPVRSYSSETLVRKPHPKAFQNVAARLGIDARACAFVGDRGDEDIEGAASVGMLTIWVRNDYSPPVLRAPDRVIESLNDLIRD